MKKRKLTPTERKNLMNAWRESENGFNMFKPLRENKKSISDTPLFKKDIQQDLF